MQLLCNKRQQVNTRSFFSKGSIAEVALCAVLAILCSVFLREALPISVRDAYAIGILPLFVCIAYYVLFCCALKTLSDRITLTELLTSAVVSLLFSACFVFGSILVDLHGVSSYVNPIIWFSIAVNAIPLFFAILMLWKTLDSCNSLALDCENVREESRLGMGKLFVLFLVCWTPVLLASWPGFFSYDVGSLYLGEWGQFESGELNAHHSVFHTLLMCNVIAFGERLVSFNFGVALFNILQAIFISALFSYVIIWMRSKGVPSWMRAASTLYFAINPVVSMFVLCSNSDTLFSAVVVFFCMCLYDLMSSNSAKRSLFVLLIIAGFLICVLRPNGPYALVLIVPLCVILSKGTIRKWIISASAACALFSILWFVPVANNLEVEKSPLQSANAFTVLSQQLAYTLTEGNLSEAELSELERKGYTIPSEYRVNIGDYAREAILGMSKSDLIVSWASVGVNHPGDFMDAFLLQTEDAWNPFSFINCETSGQDDRTSVFSCDAQDPAIMNSKIPMLLDFLESVSHELYFQKVPLLSLLVCLPAFVALVIIGLARAIITRNKSMLAVFAFIVLLVCSVLMGLASSLDTISTLSSVFL